MLPQLYNTVSPRKWDNNNSIDKNRYAENRKRQRKKGASPKKPITLAVERIPREHG